MFTAGLLLVKGFFGKIFSDWRIIAIILICCLVGVVYIKYSSLQKQLGRAQEAVVAEQQKSATLQSNLNQAVQVNSDNALVIKQATMERDNALNAVSQLNDQLKLTNNSIIQINNKINKITVPPTKITPYLSEAIKGIQEMRNSEQGVKK